MTSTKVKHPILRLEVLAPDGTHVADQDAVTCSEIQDRLRQVSLRQTDHRARAR